jgi:hypothetical protein
MVYPFFFIVVTEENGKKNTYLNVKFFELDHTSLLVGACQLCMTYDLAARHQSKSHVCNSAILALTK